MDDIKIAVKGITKVYNMYDSPSDRLKEAFSLRKKSYHNEFFALTDVSFNVKKGEIVGIMGRNGAGKSTLLKIITGILSPTYGTVEVTGRISSLLELGSGFNLEYTGIENIYFYGTIMGLSRSEIDSRLNDIISFAEIGDYIYQPVKTYSSGMFARLAFSCAINVEPEVLIVDEILSVGDIRFQAKCFNKFKEFKKKGVTILYVGHDISTMRTFCDRCIWLNQGKIVDEGDPTYISAKYVEFMYLEDDPEFSSYHTLANSEPDVKKDDIEDAVELISEEARPELSEELKDARIGNGEPLAHWGTCTGLIKDISLTVDGNDLQSCTPWDEIQVSFSVPFSDAIDYAFFSVAFSIKNREGIDLIVKTTFDDKIKIEKDRAGHRFSFKFHPCLTNGDYYLVLALENRKQAMTSYYEYIEGARYFKIFEPQGLYGQFLPLIKTSIEGEHSNEPNKQQKILE